MNTEEVTYTPKYWIELMGPKNTLEYMVAMIEIVHKYPNYFHLDSVSKMSEASPLIMRWDLFEDFIVLEELNNIVYEWTEIVNGVLTTARLDELIRNK